MKSTTAEHLQRYSPLTAVWAIAANMIGTGIFTSLSFQVVAFDDYFVILSLWVIGGIISLCGAYAYSRLAIAMPDAVGEYDYLSRLVHPSIGFVSSWVSVTVGFAAPVALIMKTMEAYLQPYLMSAPVSAGPIVLTLLLLVSLAHCTSYSTSANFHGTATACKVVLLIAFTALGFLTPQVQGVVFTPSSESVSHITSGVYAISLVYVLYTYSGWNASSYLARELPNPERTLPRSILLGTVGVSIMYLLINAMFLYTTPAEILAVDTQTGVPKDLAAVVASYVLPRGLSSMVGAIVVVLLMSSMSAMTMVGPRVSVAIGETNQRLRFFAKRTRNGVPALAIAVQSAVAAVLYVTNAFDQIITFTMMILTISTLVTVISTLHISRSLLSITAVIVFTLSNAYVLYHIANTNPESVMWTACIVVTGLVVHRVVR